MALHHSDGFVAVGTHRPQPDESDLGGKRIGAHHQNPGIGRQLAAQCTRGALGAGQDIARFRREPDAHQVICDLAGASGRVVGHEDFARAGGR